MKTSVSQVLIAVACAIMALPAPAARACAVCMGADENMGEALNGAIYMMIACIFTMLGLIAAVAVSMVRRANRVHPIHAEFAAAGFDKS